MIRSFTFSFFPSTLLVLTVAALSSDARASVSVIPSNADLPAAELITDASGNPLAGASISYAVGVFPPAFDIANASAAALLAAFDQNGSEQPGSSAVPGALAAFGGPTVEDAATSIGGLDVYSGNPIHVVIGNAATLAASTKFIVYRAPKNWPVEIEALGAAAPFTLMDSTLLRGTRTTVQNASPPAIASQLNGTPGVTFPVPPDDLGDSDGDGIINFLEQAFDTNLNDWSSGQEGLPVATSSPGTLTIRYRQLDTPGSITYTVEESTDLGSTHLWTTVVNAPALSPDQSGAGLNSSIYQYTISTSPTGTRFLRVRITK